jgi:hypothetical protein
VRDVSRWGFDTTELKPQLDSEVVVSEFVPQYEKLSTTRSLFEKGLNAGELPALVKSYRRWVDEDVYMCLKSLDSDELLFVKGAKRGNDVYGHRVKQSVEEKTSYLDSSVIENLCVRVQDHRRVSNVFLLTLSYDPSIEFNITSRMWERVSYDYNKFRSRMRKRFGGSWAVRSFEAQKNGNPHIHVEIVFEKPQDVKFHKDRYILKNRKVKDWIADAWGRGFVDVRATAKKKNAKEGSSSVRNYILKDLIKSVRRDSDERDTGDWNTLALNWLYRRQSFAISGSGLLEGICKKNGYELFLGLGFDLINSMHNSNLIFEEVEGFEYVGICCIRFGGLDPPWRFVHDYYDALNCGLGNVISKLDYEGS